jgi:ElaB/YqjD/DUF883 family membrane-anchored ribosome-binding protein
MDQQSDFRPQRPDEIRQHIDDTRDNLTEKLEALEQKVKNTLADARGAVTDTATGVMQSLDCRLQAFKVSVHDGVASVKHALDPGRQVRRHPWTMLAGSMTAGYVMGRLLSEPHPVRRKMIASSAEPLPPAPKGRILAAEPGVPEASLLSELKATLAPEVRQLEALALGALLGMARDAIKRSIGPSLSLDLAGVIDRVTSKLGHAFEGPRHFDTGHRQTR